MNKIIHYSFVFSLLFLIGSFKAQSNYENDAALWIEIHLEKKVNDKLDLYFDHKSRIKNNISEYSLAFVDVGVSYNPVKFLKFQLEYGYGKSLQYAGYYGNRHRANFSVILRKEVGKWMLAYRSMLQMRLTDIYSRENGTIPANFNRNKLTLKYEINKRFTSYVAEELYLPLNQSRNKGLSRSRSTAGLLFNINKKSGIEAFFIYQHELNAFNSTNRDFIYGIAYSFEF